MKRFSATAFAALAFAALASAQQAVLYAGSDWCDAASGLQKVWESAGFKSEAGVSLATVDAPERVTDAVKATWERQKSIRMDVVGRIPAFAWFDATGSCVLLREGLPAAEGEEARALLRDCLAAGREREAQVAALLAKNDAGSTGEALRLVASELGVRGSQTFFKRGWEQLKRLDPSDETGWNFALTFDPSADACCKVQDFVKNKDAAGAEAYIAGLESKCQAHLDANQRQGLLMLRYIVHQDDRAKDAEMEALLQTVLAMGGDTHFGLAAQGLLCLRGKGPVAIPYGWRDRHVRKGKQTWKVAVGVPRVLRRPGRYALTLAREKGRGTFRLDGLTVSGLYLAVGAEIPVGGTVTVYFDVPGPELPDSLLLAVDCPDPDGEIGKLSLARVPAERVVRPGLAIDKSVRPWGLRPGEPEAAAYARAVIPESAFRAICGRPGGAAFLEAFFGNGPWMEDFFSSGEPSGTWETALDVLNQMVCHVPEMLSSEVVRRWGTAAALNVSSPGKTDDMILLLQEMLALRAEKQLARGSDALRCDQLRCVLLPDQCDADNARWLAERHCVPPRQYGDVCWAAPYRTYNFFGRSVQGSDYYPAWEHAYLRHERAVKVGGVCGALSYYGSAAAKAHGVPSTPGGQPGHCAYSLWSESAKQWRLAYNVNPYTGCHFGLWGDARRFSYMEMSGRLFAAKGFRASMRALRRAEVMRLSQRLAPRRSALRCTAYAWEGKTLPASLEGLEVLGSWENVRDFKIDRAPRSDHVLLVWTGHLDMDRAGRVTFDVRSDDGACLYVDGKAAAGKDGLHGMVGSSETLTLSKGRHAIELRWFNFNGGRGLDVSIEGEAPAWRADQSKRYLDASRFCPANYAVWKAWSAYLKESADTPASAWRSFALSAATGLNGELEPAIELILAAALPEIKRLEGDAAARVLLVQLGAILRQGDWATDEFCDYASLLDRQAKLLGNGSDAAFALFRAALPAQYGTADAFGRLMRWGGGRFLADDADAERYVAEINALLKQHGNSGNALGKYVRESICEASKAGNREAFLALCQLQDALQPSVRQPMAFSFAGDAPLLSDRGLLRLSSYSGAWDHPECYGHVIDGLANRETFHTNEEEAPWAEVELPGEAELSAVYIGNRDSNTARLVPFVLEVSADGKQWKQVGRASKVQAEYRFTFAPVKAKYVRLTCRPEGRKTYLHLRKFCVFGKKLY